MKLKKKKIRKWIRIYLAEMLAALEFQSKTQML